MMMMMSRANLPQRKIIESESAHERVHVCILFQGRSRERFCDIVHIVGELMSDKGASMLQTHRQPMCLDFNL